MGGLLDLKSTSKDLLGLQQEDKIDLKSALEDFVQVDHLFRSEPFEDLPNTPQKLWCHIFRYLANKKKPEDIKAQIEKCSTMSPAQEKLISFGIIDNYMKIMLDLDGPLDKRFNELKSG